MVPGRNRLVPRGGYEAGLRGAASRSPRSKQQSIDLGALNDRVGYFVRRFQVWIFQDFTRTLSTAQIRPAQYSALVLIDANPGLSQSDLADVLGIERARVVRMLDELERRDYAVRLRSTQDRRSHALFLTPAGRKLLRRLEILTARHEAHVTAKIGPAHRRTLLKILRSFGLTAGGATPAT
jgi:DNA-binding MarR family transcriptional regulator